MYKTRRGDTFEGIARQFYGDESQASRIRRANPGVFEPLLAGVALTIPTAPQPGTLQPLDGPDEVAITVNGERFPHWSEVTITRSVDSVSTISLNAPFEPENTQLAAMFRPFSYAPVTVQVGGERLITGTLMHVNPSATDDDSTISVSAYGAPGVLSDCGAPVSAFPLEYFYATIEDVAGELCAPFGIKPVFETDPGAPFDLVELGPGQAIMPFLATLAAQRDILIKDNPRGDLVFYNVPTGGRPVAHLRDNAPPVANIVANFDPRRYFSDITGLSGNIIGILADDYTVKNPRLTGITRPHTFLVPDSYEGDLVTGVEANAARMFGEVASYTVSVIGWRNASGGLWNPGDLISLHAPRAMVYKPYTFLIRSVALYYQGDKRTAELTLVIPSAFSSTMPEVLPWDS